MPPKKDTKGGSKDKPKAAKGAKATDEGMRTAEHIYPILNINFFLKNFQQLVRKRRKVETLLRFATFCAKNKVTIDCVFVQFS